MNPDLHWELNKQIVSTSQGMATIREPVIPIRSIWECVVVYVLRVKRFSSEILLYDSVQRSALFVKDCFKVWTWMMDVNEMNSSQTKAS